MLLISQNVTAQRPKLSLIAFGGYNTHIFTYKTDEQTRDVIHGWQGGFGFRVTDKKLMAEIDFSFLRNSIRLELSDSIGQGIINDFNFKFKSFEIPIKLGVIPIKGPLIKWYCYTGISLRFNTKGVINIQGEDYKFSPKEVGLANPNVDWIVGTQMDIGWLNLDLLYGIGITNSLTENIRTNSQEIQISAGILF
jgi:hypothetical protein